jgi:dethiobiotin synthetase
VIYWIFSKAFQTNAKSMVNYIAIAGIHTGIGKTIASAVIAEAIGADYWKPVQAGTAERDVLQVKALISNGGKRVHDEALLLSSPMSPHAAAQIDGVQIDYTKFVWPKTDKTLLIETAGGLLSPMSASTTMADFLTHYRLPTILIAQNYLGSINHTLLTIEVMKARGIKLIGVVFNGVENHNSETFIEQYTKLPIMARIPHFNKLDNSTIIACADKIKVSLGTLL